MVASQAVQPSSVLLMLLFGLVSLAGCASLPFTPAREVGEALEPHYILAHEDGYPITTERRPDKDFPAHVKKILAGIDQHARISWSSRTEGADHLPLRILLFVHGGNNSPQDHFRRMERLLLKEGPLRTTEIQYYPIFINWNSNLGDSVVDDLVFIRFGKRLTKWWEVAFGVVTSPFVLGTRVAQSVFGATSAWWANWDNISELNTSAKREGKDDEFLFWHTVGETALIPARVLTLPVVQALGTPGWEVMKRRAELLIASHLTRNPANASKGAARLLIEELRGRTELTPNGALLWTIKTGERQGEQGPVEITLVGHSMGALVVNRILAMPRPLPVRRVVYLAAASTIDEFEQTATPYQVNMREQKYPTEIWAFTLSRLREARESRGGYLLPRGTVLVWVDSYFEPVKTVGQQRFGRHKEYQEYYPERERLSHPDRGIFVWALRHREEALAPKRHDDFGDREYFARILCTIDSKGFRDSADCEDKKYIGEEMSRGEAR